MIIQTVIRSPSGKLKNGTLKVTMSFVCSQEQFEYIESLADNTLVNIDIQEVDND